MKMPHVLFLLEEERDGDLASTDVQSPQIGALSWSL